MGNSTLPPGFVYLYRRLSAFFLLLAGTSISLRYLLPVLRQRLGNRLLPFEEVPLYAYLPVTVLAYTTFTLIRKVSNYVSVQNDLKIYDAILPPLVQSSSKDILKRLEGMNKEYLAQMFSEWIQEYGPSFRFQVFGDRRMFTTEPEHIKAILATQFNDFGKGPISFDQAESMLGEGVFNSDGEMWKFHRSVTRPYFSKDRITDFDTFDEHTDAVIQQMKSRFAEGYPIDFQDAAARFTLDSATSFLFGSNVNSVSAGLAYPFYSPLANNPQFTNHPSNRFVNAFLTAQEQLAMRSRRGTLWRMKEFWTDDVKPLRDTMDELVRPIIHEAIKRKRELSKEKVLDEENTFLANLVQHTEDEKILMDELVNILVAGRDTTSSTMAFAVYVLTQRPEIVDRLRQEIMKHVGPSRRPTYDDIRDMKYLRAFLNEILRLYPVVPFNSRTSVKATTLPNKSEGVKPYYVPAKTKVTYSIFLMHRRKDLWGPDAELFDPDRFIDGRLGKYLTRNPFIFLPFNAGPRICLGQQFAYNEMSFFLIRLLQNFTSFELDTAAMPEGIKPPISWAGAPGTKGTDKIKFISTLTMFVEGGLWVKMKPTSSV